MQVSPLILSFHVVWPDLHQTHRLEKKTMLKRQAGDFVYLTDVSLLPHPSVKAALMPQRWAALVPATVDGARWELRGFWRLRREFGLISRYRQVVLRARDRSAEPVRQKCCFCSHRRSVTPGQTRCWCFYTSAIVCLRWREKVRLWTRLLRSC